MPDDGSVAYDSEIEIGNETVRRLREERAFREAHTEGPCIYVPDSEAYADAVIHAIERRSIPLSDMTEEERVQHEKDEEKARRSHWWYMFWHCYLPVSFGILSFLYIFCKLAGGVG